MASLFPGPAGYESPLTSLLLRLEALFSGNVEHSYVIKGYERKKKSKRMVVKKRPDEREGMLMRLSFDVLHLHLPFFPPSVRAKAWEFPGQGKYGRINSMIIDEG